MADADPNRKHLVIMIHVSVAPDDTRTEREIALETLRRPPEAATPQYIVLEGWDVMAVRMGMGAGLAPQSMEDVEGG